MENLAFVGRSEYKYYMSYSDAARLMAQVSQIMSPDQYSVKGSYRVKSLYFDSFDNQDYYEKVDGYRDRKKIRLRIYDEESTYAKLEMKGKMGNYQHKYSVTLSREMAEQMIHGNYEVLLERKEEVAHKIFSLMRLSHYRPVAIIEYDRRAFVYDNFNTRITFDTNIRSEEIRMDLFEKNLNYTSVMKEMVVLEIKFDKHLAGFIQKMLAPYSLNQTAISKYCMGRRTMADIYI